jgi:hypothetical protein
MGNLTHRPHDVDNMWTGWKDATKGLCDGL